MGLYDFRQRVQDLVRSWGGLVDVANYAASYPSTVTTAASMSLRPESARGPFVAFGINGRATSSMPPSRVELSVGEARNITEVPTYRAALIHGQGSTLGIGLSAWPAPMYIGKDKALTITEATLSSASSLASQTYQLSGFHTTEDVMQRLLQLFGELRAFSFDCRPDSSAQNGNAVGQYVMKNPLELVEWCVNNDDSSPGVLDFVRATLASSQFLLGQRVSGSAALALPPVLGPPSSYIGRWADREHTMIVQERVSSGARLDVWSVLATWGRQR